jgi:hypothetical protein
MVAGMTTEAVHATGASKWLETLGFVRLAAMATPVKTTVATATRAELWLRP